MIDAVSWGRRITVGINNSFSLGYWFKYRMRVLLINNLLRIIRSRSGLISRQEVLIFASGLRRPKLSSVTSLDFVNQLVLHGVPRFVGAWSWDEFWYFGVDKAWEPVVVFVGFHGFWSELSRLDVLVILPWADVSCYRGFGGEAFGGDAEWGFLALGVEFLWRNRVRGMHFIRPRPRCRVLNILNWVIIRLTIPYMRRRRRFLRINPALGGILRDPTRRLFKIPLCFSFIICWCLTEWLSLINYWSSCLACKSGRGFEGV